MRFQYFKGPRCRVHLLMLSMTLDIMYICSVLKNVFTQTLCYENVLRLVKKCHKSIKALVAAVEFSISRKIVEAEHFIVSHNLKYFLEPVL